MEVVTAEATCDNWDDLSGTNSFPFAFTIVDERHNYVVEFAYWFQCVVKSSTSWSGVLEAKAELRDWKLET